jgi:hypothetical protein
MEDKQMKDFSWTAFFLVTGLSFFLFSKLLWMLDGTPLPVFTWLGIASIAIGSFRIILSLNQSPEEQ